MKFHGYKFPLLAVFLLTAFFSKADFISKNYDASDGLISNTVRCFMEDQEGRLWIGTDGGISIFNGYHFRSITIQNGLAGNSVRSIVQSSDGGKWIACYGDGLTYTRGGIFKKYGKDKGLTNLKINVLYSIPNALFIGTKNGLFVYHSSGDTISKISNLPSSQQPGDVRQILQWNGVLYVVTGNAGIFQLGKDKKGHFFLKKEANSYHISQLIPLNKNDLLKCDENGIFFQNKLNSSSQKFIKESIVYDYAFNQHKNACFLASWNGSNAGGGVLEWKDGKLDNVNEKFQIKSTKIRACKVLKNGLLAVGSLDDGFYLVNTHLSSFRKYTLTDIKGQFLFHDAPIFYNDTQLLTKNNKVLFTLDNDKIVSRYSAENVPEAAYSIFNFEFDNQHIHKVQVAENHIFLSTSSGLIMLSKDFDIERIFPLQVDNFHLWDSTLIFENPNHQVVIYPDIFLKKKSPVIYFNHSKNNPTKILHYQNLGKELVVWTEKKGAFFLTKEFKFKPIANAPSGRIKTLHSWKNTFILVTTKNKVFKGSIVKNKINYSEVNPVIQIDNIISASINGDNFILYTNKGLVVSLVGTIRLFNRHNFLLNKKITSAFVKGKNLFIYTKKAVFSFKLYQFLGYYLSTPKVIISNLIRKEIPYSQRSLVLDVEGITTQLPLNFKYYFSVNGGDTIPIYGDKIFLMNMSSGKYKINVLIYNNFNASWKKATSISFSKDLPIWMQWFFWVGSFLVLLSILLVFYLRRKLILRKREIKKQQIERRVSNLKLEAIRAKMNPHFMFNALNSIQNFVIDNDVDNALLYLSEFSRLMRQTLDYSSLEKISIQDEMDFLERYITIERMRFSCDIRINKSIASNVYHEQIPPMILQPLIENAFIHGMDKDSEEPQEIKISIVHEKTDELKIKITNTKRKDANTKYKHDSFALKAIRDRLTLNHPNNLLIIDDNPTFYAVIIRFTLNG